jgi:hypothetical protein
MEYIIFIFIQENGIPQVNTATDKKKEEDENIPLFQHNNLKHQRDIDEHKLKVFISIDNICFN